MKKKEKRKKIWVDPELHERIKVAATKNYRKITDELRARFPQQT